MRLLALAILALLLMPLVLETVMADFGDPISPEDQETFDQILEPVMKVYNFVKYAATVVAVLFLVFAGVSFITSGSDQAKRNQAKMMATYIVVGLIVIWVAPLVVQYLVQ